MKTPSDELFVLVKGMNAHEKRHFKLNSTKINIGSQSKTYLRIFDIINVQKRYNEKDLIFRLKKSGRIDNFSKAKNYLFKAILESLAECHSQSSTPFILRSLISQAELLFSKGLFKTALKIILKAKKLSYKYESYGYINIINNAYLNILISGAFPEKMKQYVKEEIPESIKQVEYLKNFVELKNLQMKMLSLVHESQVTGIVDYGAVNKVLGTPMLSSPRNAFTYPSKICYYNIHYASSILKRDNLWAAYVKQIEWLKYLERDKNKLELRAESYMVAISGLILTIESNPAFRRREDEIVSLYEKLIGFYSGLSSKAKTKHVSITYLHILVNFMSAFLKMGMPLEVLSVMDEVKLLEAYTDGLKETTRILLYNNFFSGYFINRKFHDALRWLTKIIHTKGNSWLELQSDARRFLMLTHYELGNYDILNSVANKAQRFMIKHNLYNEFEKILIGFFIKELPVADNKKERTEAFRALKQKIEFLKRNTKQIPALKNFDYLLWIDSKIENRNLGDIMHEKANSVRVQ